MNVTRRENLYVIRLSRGETFFEPLLTFLSENNICGGWLQGIGGATWAELGLYDLADKQYHWKRFEGPLEISNLTGVISLSEDEGIHVHTHVTIAGKDLQAHAGHLKELEVAGTCELILQPLDAINRKTDQSIGLGLLDL